MKKEILKMCMQKGFLLDKEILDILSNLNEEDAKNLLEEIADLKIHEKFITKTILSKNFSNIERVLVHGESKTVIERFIINLNYSKEEILEKNLAILDEIHEKESVKLIYCPLIPPKKVKVEDFVNHFKARYNELKDILQARNLENLTSIRKIGFKKENYTVIAAILNKRVTKNKNLILEVEDSTGSISLLINQNKKELFDKAKELVLDDIVAFKVTGNSEILYCNDIIFPDCILQEKRRNEEEEIIAFTSDIHIGSTMFLEDNFIKFIKWINGEEGDEKQKELAQKIKYLFLTGDNIDGVGVYPDQERFLKIKDIKDQYKRLAELLSLIRKDITIIMCPGQHDGVRVAEPQPIVEEVYAPELHKIKNLVLVANPSLVEVSGFKILMYHGASMHSLVDEIEDIRMNYGHRSPTRVVKELLKRRHLATIHGSVVYIPNEKEDPLVIKQIPDIVSTGDWHRPEISNYNNILLVASSCWQSITPFEEKVGNMPDPCKVPLFNLKTREVKILDFS